MSNNLAALKLAAYLDLVARDHKERGNEHTAADYNTAAAKIRQLAAALAEIEAITHLVKS